MSVLFLYPIVCSLHVSRDVLQFIAYDDVDSRFILQIAYPCTTLLFALLSRYNEPITASDLWKLQADESIIILNLSKLFRIAYYAYTRIWRRFERTDSISLGYTKSRRAIKKLARKRSSDLVPNITCFETVVKCDAFHAPVCGD